MELYVGTSGFSFKEWKGSFYPEKIKADAMLAFYAERFRSVEINATFYQLPKAKVLEGWSAQTPDDFSFVLKASRRITHIGRLKEVGDSTKYMFEQAAALGPKLGPVLVQLPPNFKKDVNRLRAFFDAVPDGRDVALEVRNPTWLDDDVYTILKDRKASLCVAHDGEPDSVDAPLMPSARFGYLRLRAEGYDEEALRVYRAKIAAVGWERAYVFFKHEDEGRGPELAKQFLDLQNS